MRLPWVLSQLGLVSDAQLLNAMIEASDFERVADELLTRKPAEIDGINPFFLKKHKILPVEDDGKVTIITTDAEDRLALDAMRFVCDGPVTIRLARIDEIDDRLNQYYGAHETSDIAKQAASGLDEELERLHDGISEAPIIRLVHNILSGAIKAQASDVHIEPMARQLSVRYRIDGRLSEVERHPLNISEAVASRIKVMAGLDISESRLPQDGRIKLTVRGEDVDIRVSTSPIANGESIVMRLLGRSTLPLDLDRLGLPKLALKKLRHALEQPHGIILLTGPTGSGKTTTLYSAINALRRPEVKILTVEDPVEIMLDGVNQVQVHSEIGLDYASSLRAFLRQDPDILMIGEIRDSETAEIAHRAALTGHLVLSTLHTNSALGAYTRLDDIGVERFLVASTVVATIAQRLVRCLCRDCKSEEPVTAYEKTLFENMGLTVPEKLFHAQGCPKCHGSGYAGRRPLIEIVEVDEILRAKIRTGDAQSHRIMPAETLLGHGFQLAGEGVTDVHEVERVAGFQ